jgi:hypothetical protein
MNRDCQDFQDYLRLSRFIENFQDFSIFVEFPTLFAHFEANFQAQNVKKMLGTKILNKIFDRDQEIIEKSIKIQKVSISLDKSQSQLRSTNLNIPVEKKSRYLDLN